VALANVVSGAATAMQESAKSKFVSAEGARRCANAVTAGAEELLTSKRLPLRRRIEGFDQRYSRAN